MDTKALYELYKKHPVITTDSRNCPKGSIFIALKGASFNGNAFAEKALEEGCAYAIIDEAQYKKDDRYIVVDDCLQTFKNIAREHRRQFDIPVIGITGTNGKTTTKELIAAVLQKKYNVMYTQGNFNNDIGVPKTLLRLDETHDIAVVEMGASHPGDIKTLVETAEPTCGLITNVGRAHLQGFGSFEGVKKTKGELYDFLKKHNALTFINSGNADLTEMAAERGLDRCVCYSQAENENVCGEMLQCAPLLSFRWKQADGEWHEVDTQLIGAYNLDNILAAIAIGLYFEVPANDISNAISEYKPNNNRSQLDITAKNKLIVDAYNANPTSMAVAIDNFIVMAVEPKMAIVGQMGELGDVSDEEHRKVVKKLTEANFDEVWLVGENYKDIPCPFRKFSNVEEVKNAIADAPVENRYILIKGSNAVKLYELKDLL